MRRLALALTLTLAGCELDELLNPTPMCPKRVAVDTLGWIVVTQNGVRSDSLPMTGNAREVCTTTRHTVP
jgi:hypothetical protein